MESKTRKAQIVIASRDSLQQNKFLLLQTNPERGEYWQNCTGKVEDHEEFEEGALREAAEETGLISSNIEKIIDLHLEHEFSDRWGRDVLERSYLLITKHIWDVVLDKTEHQSFKWISPSEVTKESVKFAGNFEALKKAKERIES